MDIENIPGITLDQISLIQKLIKSENISKIIFRKASGYQTDDIYEFINEKGYSPFSILIHPDKNIHIWRPL